MRSMTEEARKHIARGAIAIPQQEQGAIQQQNTEPNETPPIQATARSAPRQGPGTPPCPEGSSATGTTACVSAPVHHSATQERGKMCCQRGPGAGLGRRCPVSPRHVTRSQGNRKNSTDTITYTMMFLKETYLPALIF